MKKGLLAILLGSMVTIGGAAAQKATSKVTCTLINKTVDECCCVKQKDGQLYCTLAKKVVDPCCCKPAEK